MILWFYGPGVFEILLEDRFVFENIWILTVILCTLIALTACMSRTWITFVVSYIDRVGYLALFCMPCTCWSPLQCNKFDLSATNIFNCINTVLSSALSILSRCFSEYLSCMSLFIIHSASFSHVLHLSQRLTTFKNDFRVYNSKNTHTNKKCDLMRMQTLKELVTNFV